MRKKTTSAGKRKCGLCGKTKNLMKTECCGQWICDDEHKYVLFSYDTNSCSRNHRRYTLCGFHYAEEHEGPWQNCSKCKNAFETELYVYYGTNEFNFEKLQNPPAYEPTRCSKCGVVISLGSDEHTVLGKEYWCEECGRKEMRKRRH
jgi:hypothetical protein